MARRLVTITTDIGSVYAAQVKAALLHYVSASRLVDLAHDLPAHRVGEAAFLLRQMAIGFPPGTVDLAIVDPGVGGSRAPVAVRCRDGTYLVGPDNGILYPLARALRIERVIRLDPKRVVRRRPISPTFEGRDLFAHAAGRLASGSVLSDLGAPSRLTRLDLPKPDRRGARARGTIVHVDRFGDLITNIPSDWPSRGPDLLAVRIGRRRHRLRRVRTYEELARGGAGVLGSSFGTLEISVREGRASDRFRVGTGTPVEVDWNRPRAP